MSSPTTGTSSAIGRKIIIDDFDDPYLPLPVRLFNTIGAICPSRFPDVDSLLAMATKRSGGLTNFGSDFMEPLSVLVHSIQNEAPLSAFGRFLQKESIVGCLVARLHLEELYRLHPEIEEECIEKPIIISGLPRTGTSHLFNLLSRDESLHWIPYWETLSPFPAPNERSPDGRVKAGSDALKLINWCIPKFAAMHEYQNDWPHEELQLQMQSFIGLGFEAFLIVPSYSKWYRTADRAPSYAYLKRCLKALQYLRGGERKRWLLKCPEHSMNIPHLVREFPDATYVQTHRDPVQISASISTMLAYATRMNLKAGCGTDMARHWSGMTEDMLRSSIVDRPHFPKGQVIDVHFHQFMSDMKGTVQQILEHAGHKYTVETEERIDAFLADNPPGKHGKIDYRAAMSSLGIDGEERRRTLSFYTKHFGIEEDFQ
mmetsp:Transcript_14498/g.29301  ORF Transcript_14498/g.29301 Transcript_14498/m.29301 type:complete len:429 (-) Transcript_14498:506-1792(-)